MSELIDNTRRKKDLLKHLMLQLHEGETAEAVKVQLARLMGEVPYELVVEVEQELVNEGLPAEEILRFCDIHTAVLKGQISHEGSKEAPPGHPVHTFKEENRALQWELDSLNRAYSEVLSTDEGESAGGLAEQMKTRFHALTDVEKHYQRKEHLLFPFLEKHGITAPPKVMWGKHDEAREMLKSALEVLEDPAEVAVGELQAVVDLVLKPASTAIGDMIFREEQILFPLSMDTLTDAEWYAVFKQSPSVGFCLYDPDQEWRPEGDFEELLEGAGEEKVQLPTGALTPMELNAILNTIPFDLTFVDRDDTVRYFTHGRERIFTRTRAILGRKVQFCHPPSSVHIVEQIIEDFRSGKQSHAPFWIELKGRFIHIEYFALRDNNGEYLGTLEVSQDLTGKRSLKGEQRLLSYTEENFDEE